ncbi:diacylglycerol kinase family lipid kinase [Bacillus shivajii]|uniref:diacylglycerol/lipid kinase family protein n=1 Tax=Bacillus shivajii TaxID=1983719 RepID=UPI001CFB68E1|nr:diacylglycerol kinase family protein [Bacillus shivajii]UCZ51980.1 diacylglycerol kinase family lipid kinase [Bacillus shivajii]
MIGFIINSRSGNGKGGRVWKRVERYMMDNDYRFIACFTESEGDVKATVKDFVEKKVTTIIAVGGDGTIHHVANELAYQDVSLGVIPAGSGNDFARSLGIPMDWMKALKRILINETRQVDLLHTGKQYCLTVTGIGLDGMVAKNVNRSSYKRYLNHFKLGGLSYAFCLLETLKSYQPTDIELTIDGETQKFTDVWLVAVANAPNYAGGIAICPEASFNDGLLDLCIVQRMSKWELLNLFPKAYKGKHITKENVTILKGREVHITSEKPIFIHSDGEPMMESPISLRIEKDALRVV